MGVLDRLFSKSPFTMLKEMMAATRDVVVEVPQLFEALKLGDTSLLDEMAERISEQERQIDDIKNQIRQVIANSMFLSLPKREFLNIILTLDGVSDRIEDLAKLFSLRKISYPDALEEQNKVLIYTLLKINEYVGNIILTEMNGLVEASFSGPEVKGVLAMIDGVASKAHELETLSHETLKVLFRLDDTLHPSEVLLWSKIILKIEDIGHSLEKTATNIRFLMEK